MSSSGSSRSRPRVSLLFAARGTSVSCSIRSSISRMFMGGNCSAGKVLSSRAWARDDRQTILHRLNLRRRAVHQAYEHEPDGDHREKTEIAVLVAVHGGVVITDHGEDQWHGHERVVARAE